MKKNKRGFLLWILLAAVFLVGSILTAVPGPAAESVQVTMRDAVLHDANRISLLGWMPVNPGLISAYVITAALLIFALLIRIFLIPKFQYVPGKMQMLLEEAVGVFDRMAQSAPPRLQTFLGSYIFAAGVYVFFGTLFELFGIQWITTAGHSIALPAPLSDVNAAISLGCLSYLIILSGGIAGNGLRGAGATLKEFSLPISMSFRLFGALLGGLLVTELVYYYAALRYVFPVLVGVMFTLLHALIQSYVLTMLTALFYGEVSEPSAPKKKKQKRTEIAQNN